MEKKEYEPNWPQSHQQWNWLPRALARHSFALLSVRAGFMQIRLEPAIPLLQSIRYNR